MKKILVILCTFLILRTQVAFEGTIDQSGLIVIEISGNQSLINQNGLRLFSWEL